jgi:hypothetical protein
MARHRVKRDWGSAVAYRLWRDKLGIGDWERKQKPPEHPLSTIVHPRSGWIGDSDAMWRSWAWRGGTRDFIRSITTAARLCSAALVQSRKCGEEAECRKGEFLEKANIGRTLSDLSACPGIIQRATPGEPQVLHRRRMLPGDCPEFAVHRVSLKSNLKIELRTLYRTAPRERRIG